MDKKFLTKFISSPVFFFAIFIFYSSTANAATLYLAPSTAKTVKDSTFVVLVQTNTEGEFINVAEATVNFPSNMLQVVGVSSGNTFTFQLPGSPGKTKSTAFFSAGIPSPGYKGAGGVLGKITFKAIAVGKATISIASGKVLLNDGNATDALRSKTGSIISISAPIVKPTPVVEEPVVEEPVPEEVVPAVPTVEPGQKEIIIEPTTQPVVTPVTPQQVVLQPASSVVAATITVTVQDLLWIILFLVICVIILLIIAVYLFVNVYCMRFVLKKDLATKKE